MMQCLRFQFLRRPGYLVGEQMAQALAVGQVREGHQVLPVGPRSSALPALYGVGIDSEDAFPPGEDQVERDAPRPAFVGFGDEGE